MSVYMVERNLKGIAMADRPPRRRRPSVRRAKCLDRAENGCSGRRAVNELVKVGSSATKKPS